LETDEKLRTIRIVTDQEKLREISQLDGCYCLTTSLNVDELDKESVHARYQDLARGEKHFGLARPINWNCDLFMCKKIEHARGHVFVVMLSYLLIQKLREYWNTLDMTVEEGIELWRLLKTSFSIQATIEK
jgi:hypothetical protein